jgi:hypothetical protein
MNATSTRATHFFEIQPGKLINLDLVRRIDVEWDHAVLWYVSDTSWSERIAFTEYVTPEWSFARVRDRIKALAQ